MRVTARKAIFIALVLCCVVVLLAHPETLSFGPVEEPHPRSLPAAHSASPVALPPRTPAPEVRKEADISQKEVSRAAPAGLQGRMTTLPPSPRAQQPSVNFSADAATLLRTITELNNQQVIYNKDRFPLDFSSASLVVIVIMVHKRADYLEAALASLRGVPDIGRALLVLSHDHLDAAMDKAAHTIDFCAYMRIYSPHATQLHPRDFPGEDPNDCPRDVSREVAIQQKCNNALHPDSYGHYRESKFCAIKHHWWWKAAFVFDSIKVLSAHAGPVLFLEEDYAVVPDALAVLRATRALLPQHCPECAFITLGTYDDSMGLGPDAIAITKWQSVKHNMGMVFDRSFWERLRGCARQFCTYDDYNWDWTLAHIQRTGCAGPMQAAVVGVARVHHLGVCGVHAHAADCDVHKAFQTHLDAVHRLEKDMFPTQLRLVTLPGEQHLGQPNGGWGDVRDHALCMSIAGEPL